MALCADSISASCINSTISAIVTLETREIVTTGQVDVIDVVVKTKITPLINDETKKILEIVLQITLFIVTSMFGIVANAINIVVYWKHGLRESITLGFFALSVSDFFVVLLPLAASLCYIAKFTLIDVPINFIGFHYVSTAWLRQAAYSFSCILTAFLSIERCCCVILPFKVKQIFTQRRTLVIIVVMIICHIIAYVPIFSTHQLRWLKDPRRNGSEILTVWYAPNREVIEAFNFIAISIVTPTLSQIVLTISAVVMISGLREASKFRRAATSQATSNTKTSEREDSSGLSSRDARLVKGMVFLVGILSTSNVPWLAFIYAMLIEPELDLHRGYHNIYSTIFGISFVLSNLNAFLNVFVYYKTSSRYKQIFQETVICRKQQ